MVFLLFWELLPKPFSSAKEEETFKTSGSPSQSVTRKIPHRRAQHAALTPVHRAALRGPRLEHLCTPPTSKLPCGTRSWQLTQLTASERGDLSHQVLLCQSNSAWHAAVCTSIRVPENGTNVLISATLQVGSSSNIQESQVSQPSSHPREPLTSAGARLG